MAFNKLESALHRKHVEVEHEIGIARHLQGRALPLPSGELGPLRWRIFHRPGTTLAGDWFGIHHIRTETGEEEKGYVGFALFDVTGHGIQAALSTTIIHSQWVVWCAELQKALAGSDLNEEDHWQVCNRFLLELPSRMDAMFKGIGRGETATACMGIIDLEDGRVFINNCGHPAPLIERHSPPEKSGTVSARGDLIGDLGRDAVGTNADESNEPREHLPERRIEELRLDSGDSLVLYSDGVQLSARSSSAWPKSHLRAARRGDSLTRKFWDSARAARGFMREHPDEVDDITIFVLKWSKSSVLIASPEPKQLERDLGDLSVSSVAS